MSTCTTVANELSNGSSVNQPPAPTDKSKTSIWPSFWTVAIPAYTYFFGYTSKKYYLEGLGFDSPDISGEPGPIYDFAFTTFFFMNSEALKNAWPMYFKTLNEGWVDFSLTALGVGVVFYIAAVTALKIAEVRARRNPNGSKLKVKPLWASVAISIGTIIANVAIIPIVIVIMTIISLTFIPPVVIGLAMANKEISEFTCEIPTESKAKIAPCTTILLEDKTVYTGNIYHRDSEYLYVLTESDAYSVPLDSIKSRSRSLQVHMSE